MKDWEDELKWVVHKIKGKTLCSKVLQCAWSAHVYAIMPFGGKEMHVFILRILVVWKLFLKVSNLLLGLELFILRNLLVILLI